MTKVAINGLGRIGRAVLKILVDTPQLELVAIHDIAPTQNLAYLLAYDTACSSSSTTSRPSRAARSRPSRARSIAIRELAARCIVGINDDDERREK